MKTALIPLKIPVLLQKLPCFVQKSSYNCHIKGNLYGHYNNVGICVNKGLASVVGQPTQLIASGAG